MMTKSGNAIFSDFDPAHEKCLVALVNEEPVKSETRDAALLAFCRCQSKIIEALKDADGSQRRSELRILYEGLSVANEFISQVGKSGD